MDKLNSEVSKNPGIMPTAAEKLWADKTVDEKLETVRAFLLEIDGSYRYMSRRISDVEQNQRKMEVHSHDERTGGIVVPIQTGSLAGMLGQMGSLRNRNPLD